MRRLCGSLWLAAPLLVVGALILTSKPNSPNPSQVKYPVAQYYYSPSGQLRYLLEVQP